MQAFIAFAWTWRADSVSAHVARMREAVVANRPHYGLTFEAPGLLIFEAPPQSAADGGQSFARGRLVGIAFDGRDRVSGADLEAIAAAPLGVVDAVWGRYVLFVEDRQQARVDVLRDPSGALPCFWCESAGAHVFFSDPDDFTAFDRQRRAIDWGYVSERLFDNRTLSLATGFEGIRELAPGALARLSGGRCTIEQVWSLERIAARASCAPTFEDARRQVRDAVMLSCSAWGSCFRAAGVRLSGGFDSSVVTSALRPVLQDLIGLNFATPTAEGDERQFARAAALHASVALVEHVRTPAGVSLEVESSKAGGCRPPLWLADSETDLVEAAFANARGIDVFFSGRGGDNVFFRAERPFALTDMLASRGYAAWVGAAWRQALACRRPLVGLLDESLKLRAGSPHTRTPPSYLTAKALELRLYPPPEDDRLAPGKRRHVLMVEDRVHYFDSRVHADYIYPLVSQPVIEACLALPTFVLSADGQERSLAREALKDLAPRAVLERRTKGQTTSYLMAILINNLAFLRRFLLDGGLVEAGLVDRAGLEPLLKQAALMKAPEQMAGLVGLLSVEAWLQRTG